MLSCGTVACAPVRRFSALSASTNFEQILAGTTAVDFAPGSVHSAGDAITLSADGIAVTLGAGIFLVSFQVGLGSAAAVTLSVEQDGAIVSGSRVIHPAEISTASGSQLVSSAGGSVIRILATPDSPPGSSSTVGDRQIVVTQVGFNQLD
jgi:hypothetical protein